MGSDIAIISGRIRLRERFGRTPTDLSATACHQGCGIMSGDPISRSVDPVRLQGQLVEFFSLEDLRNLCFELGIDFDDLSGEGKKGKARELVIYCRNRAMTDRLIEKARQARPLVTWDQEEEDEAQTEQTDDSPGRRLYALVKAFNQNRHQPMSTKRTRMGDDIAYQMRELAPELDGQFDVAAWLVSDNIGKRVAAVEFLDWKQDTEYFRILLDRLFVEKPFVQFHILIALNSLLDQLAYNEMRLLQERLKEYNPEGDGSRNLWSVGLQKRVEEWFKLVE